MPEMSDSAPSAQTSTAPYATTEKTSTAQSKKKMTLLAREDSGAMLVYCSNVLFFVRRFSLDFVNFPL
jgi:hypothetical protein